MDDDLTQNIYSKSIRFFRSKANLSREQLAQKARCSILDLDNLEDGCELPSLYLLSKLCSALNIEIGDLFKDN